MKKIYNSSKSTKEKRGITNDQFYTKPEIAEKIVNYIKKQDWFKNIQRIIEPSAGNGVFSDLFSQCEAFDIDPKKANIIKADYLSLSFDNKLSTLIIGNPPFGRQSTLAIKFLNKSCEFAQYIAFILPRSFKKFTLQNKIKLTHSILYQQDLPSKSFRLINNVDYDVPCVFQIWHQKPRNIKILKKTTKYFEWTGKEDGNIAIRRVGINAGKIFIKPEYNKVSEQSFYFIKTPENKYKQIVKCFQSIELNIWQKKSKLVSGPCSLSKSEIIEIFEKYYKI